MTQYDTFTPQPMPSSSKAPGPQWSLRRVRLVGYIVGVVLTIGLAAVAVWVATAVRDNSTAVDTDTNQSSGAVAPVALQRPVVSEAGLVDKSGIRLVQIAITGGGGLIDLRFQVVDPDKAVAIHGDTTPPTLVDEASGVIVNQLLMGHSHTDPFKAGETYYLVFDNPGNLVQRGNTVSVLLGNAQVEHVTVK